MSSWRGKHVEIMFWVMGEMGDECAENVLWMMVMGDEWAENVLWVMEKQNCFLAECIKVWVYV